MASYLLTLFLFGVFLVVCASKPNIIYILTDDQDIKLGSLKVQPKVRSMLIEQGLFFENGYVTTPVCCPSRSSILTGKYVHNHKTYENGVKAGCNAPSWRNLNENKTMGAYMSRAGYKTGFFGKYINNYALPSSGVGVEHIPPGWTRWFGLVGNSKFYNYKVSNQGKTESHGSDYAKDYFTDVVKREAVQFIMDSAAGAKSGDTPFFAYIATPAPHRPMTPAPQYANNFSNWTAPRSASYGMHGADKHWIISEGTPTMTTQIAGIIDDQYRDRLRSLLSVDDLVEEVINTLKKEGVLDNTYIFYNSDHGYHLGQFNQQGEKRQPYDEDIRVPFIVRGPGVPANETTLALALNIDLAPTFIDLAGSPVPEDMDGTSLKPVLQFQEERSKQDGGSYQFMVEYYGEGGSTGCMHNTAPVPFNHDCHNNTFLTIRGADSSSKKDYIYAQFYSTDQFPITSDPYFTEYYDLNEDLWETVNAVKKLSSDQQKQMKDMIAAFYDCSGKDCQQLRRKPLV